MLIGLSESGDAYERRGYTPDRLLDTQHRFSKRFGMPFSFERKPRMAGTSRACRAIVAARELDPALGEAALRALQLLQFTTPRVLDDDDDLRAVLATVPGLDADAIVDRIDDPEIVELLRGRPRPRALRRGLPDARPGPPLDERRAGAVHGAVRDLRAGRPAPRGGRLPALRGLRHGPGEPGPGPEPPARARGRAGGAAEFPEGLTTAELASVMRPSDLVDADIEATAAAAGASWRPRAPWRGSPPASDAIWRAGERRVRGAA